MVPSLLFLFSAGSAWRLTLVENAGDVLAKALARAEVLGSTRKVEREERRRDMLGRMRVVMRVAVKEEEEEEEGMRKV
jgi:hypothetical protein